MKLFVFCLLIFSANCSVEAQRNVIQNLQGFDEHRQYHFGFYIGTNQMGGKLSLNNSIFTNDTIFSVNLKPKTGFNLGVIVDLHLGDYFDIRSLFPTLSFGQRDFHYRVKTEDGDVFTDIRSVESTYVSAPIEIKYKSSRYGNFRAYLIGGGEIAYDLVSNKDVDAFDKSIIRLNNWNYGYSFGFGFEFFLEYFKFAPQIKWTKGLNNLLINDDTPFTNIINKLNSNMVVISLTFEG
ncbi:MAG: hypothetical protein ACJA0Q_000349 [Saprospiraceae bacterium]|jgi:hypothetical protein